MLMIVKRNTTQTLDINPKNNYDLKQIKDL